LIRKQQPPAVSQIKKTEVPDEGLRFSFRYFCNDEELCPKNGFSKNYTQKLAERLKELSAWTVARFTGETLPEVKNHRINWPDTSRATGFRSLPAQVRDGEAWQFSITRNEHGRVHGLLIGHTFYVVWLDVEHKLYPKPDG
jgi:hypothetical protein